MEGMENELDQRTAREEAARKDLADSRTENFKLSCAKKELREEVHNLRSAAAETEAQLLRLKREVEGLEA